MAHNLKGAAAKLAKLVEDHGAYEFEGFTWLQGHIEKIAEHLGVTEKTIKRAIAKPPFHHISRSTKEHGKHILLKIGTEPCETDHVFKLRATWVKGLVYFNAALASQLRLELEFLKAAEAPKNVRDRIAVRIAQADDGAKNLDKIKAGEKISFDVKPAHMGQLRGLVQQLGADAPGVLSRLVTFKGWSMFVAALKIEERLKRFYHWPNLGVMLNNLDLAVSTYVDLLQGDGKIDLAESKRLNALAAAFEAKMTA